jgi:apolipoprotein N-acyltransferase
MTAPLLSLRLSLAAAAIGGVLLWLSFPPVGLGYLAVPGVALVTAAAWRTRVRRGLLVGLIAGIFLFGPLLEWMRVIGPDAWAGLTLLCAAWITLAGAGMSLVTRLPLAPLWVGAVWVLEEALRGRIPWGGFPWGNLAFSQPDTALGEWATLGGSPFATFMVAAIGAGIVTIVLDWRAGRRMLASAWAASLLAAAVLPSLVLTPSTGDRIGGPDAATVALVQGGTPQVGMGAMDVRRAVLDNHVQQTLDLAAAIDAGEVPQPEFVLWPENSTDIDPFSDQTVADAITAAARAVGVPILVGAVTTVPGNPNGVWNVGIVWDPQTGPTDMYIKTHPVPFGEYVPFRDVLANIIGRFDRVPRDFIAGSEPGNLDIGGVAVGNVICFEIAYREVVNAVLDGGARLLTVQTNNATYGGTSQPDQQLGIERLRALEFGRTVLVAATSGVSAVIGADGRVDERLGEDQTGWIVTTVPLSGELTPASRVGQLVELLLILAAVGAVLVAATQSRRRRDEPVA